MSFTHDPKKVLENLRNHLTQPEANVSFLFGAGTSCAVRVPATVAAPVAALGGAAAVPAASTRALIPNVADLTAICAKEIRKLDPPGNPPRFGDAYDKIEIEVRPTSRPTNIEDILSCVRRKMQAVGATDTLAGLSSDELVKLEATIKATIAEQVNPDASNFPNKLPHDDFVRWISRMPRTRPVEIFTTNYDILLETALEAERVPAFDGFVGCNRPFFSHDSLTRSESAPGAAWTRLWKIHGSINWRIDNVRGRERIVRTDPHNEGEMIMPSHYKYDELRKQPYSALMDRLTKALDRDDAILFVSGYSWGDEHINTLIFDALEAKKRPHVVALQYTDPEVDSVLVERAKRYLNLLVLGPRSAYIGGRDGEWKLEELRNATQIEGAFRPDPAVGSDPQTGKGTLELGDFAEWAKFLGGLTGAS
ncbi:SIR2 family protein [Hoeflea alexandrii]|uniref:SIR2 family NAD-dependent protein deacylase n=1 Tax=Hoeflea alexandrii TaxID=288436 RepID=UPI0035CFBAD0